jgi:hypothetical protein
MQLEVTNEEALLLRDIIDLWCEGLPMAKELTTTDPTIESAEQLLDLMAGYDSQIATLNSVRKRLNHASD